MKNLLHLLLILFLYSCNTAKHYANYRFGGKSKQEEKIGVYEKTTSQDSTTNFVSTKVPILQEIIVNDTLMIKSLPFNKKMIVIKEKKISVSAISVPVKKEMKTSSQKIKPKKYNTKKKSAIKNSPMKGLDFYWSRVLVWAAIIGIIVFFISDSIGLGILTVLLIIAGGFIVLVLAIAIFIWLLFEIIGSIIGNSNRSYSKKKNQ